MTSCIEWVGSNNGRGYGTVYQRWDRTRKRSIYAYAHRLAYEKAYGPIPQGMLVCHRCDNPPCINPDHLFLGTVRDNADDMLRKGRARGRVCKGEDNGAARLTATQVQNARERVRRGETITAVAREFGVHPSTVGLAVRGRTWKEIPA